MKRLILIRSDGPITDITTPEGEAVHGIRRATVTLELGKMPVAQLELLARFSGPAEAQFFVRDPTSGLVKQVDRIEFTDGTTFPPHD